jgi:hypothetical protein
MQSSADEISYVRLKTAKSSDALAAQRWFQHDVLHLLEMPAGISGGCWRST